MFDMYRSVPVSGARNDFKSLLHEVAYRKRRVLLTHHKEPMAAVVPMEDLNLLDFADQRKRADAEAKAAKHNYYRDDKKIPAEDLLFDDGDVNLGGNDASRPAYNNTQVVREMLAGLEESRSHAKDFHPDAKRVAYLTKLEFDIRNAASLTKSITEFLSSYKIGGRDQMLFEQQAKNSLTLQGHLHSMMNSLMQLSALEKVGA